MDRGKCLHLGRFVASQLYIVSVNKYYYTDRRLIVTTFSNPQSPWYSPVLLLSICDKIIVDKIMFISVTRSHGY